MDKDNISLHKSSTGEKGIRLHFSPGVKHCLTTKCLMRVLCLVCFKASFILNESRGGYFSPQNSILHVLETKCSWP